MDLVLYGAALSPFVRKVEVVLREKALDFEMESINMPFPDWYTEISPARRMPALRDRDISAEGPNGVIPDSSAICAFLERLQPEPAFYPKDPYEYGRAIWYEEYADTELASCIAVWHLGERAGQFQQWSSEQSRRTSHACRRFGP